MYLTYLKTMLVSALSATFDSEYPVVDFQGTHVGIEYPVDPQEYPGIWVDYDDSQKLRRAGVDHHETLANANGTITPYTRWEFGGTISFTVVALSSLERDRLYDEIVRVIAFGAQDPATYQFRQTIENNDFIAANINFDEIEPRGNAAAPGTPWGTDEILYERTINLDILGEFLADTPTGSLLPLSKILTTATESLAPLVDEPAPAGTGVTDWH